MNEYKNKWIWLDLLYFKDEHQEINKLDLIHPLDVELFKSNPTNTLYECVEVEDGFLVIKNKGDRYRIKKEAVKQLMPNPRFKWDETVFQVSKPEIEAKVEDFFWHHKNQEYFYTISVNGKRKSNRYLESELYNK